MRAIGHAWILPIALLASKLCAPGHDHDVPVTFFFGPVVWDVAGNLYTPEVPAPCSDASIVRMDPTGTMDGAVIPSIAVK